MRTCGQCAAHHRRLAPIFCVISTLGNEDVALRDHAQTHQLNQQKSPEDNSRLPTEIRSHFCVQSSALWSSAAAVLSCSSPESFLSLH